MHDADAEIGGLLEKIIISKYSADLQDVKHVKLEADCFLHRIACDDTTLGKASMMKDFLRAAKIVVSTLANPMN